MLLALFAWLLFAIFSAVGAGTKNRSGVGWFFIGLLFGPFGLLVFAMPKLEPKGAPAKQPTGEFSAPPALTSEPGWDCPACGQSNEGSLQNCAGCGHDRDQTETICPMCRETIKVGALKCKHCGEVFSEPAGVTQ